MIRDASGYLDMFEWLEKGSLSKENPSTRLDPYDREINGVMGPPKKKEGEITPVKPI